MCPFEGLLSKCFHPLSSQCHLHSRNIAYSNFWFTKTNQLGENVWKVLFHALVCHAPIPIITAAPSRTYTITTPCKFLQSVNPVSSVSDLASAITVNFLCLHKSIFQYQCSLDIICTNNLSHVQQHHTFKITANVFRYSFVPQMECYIYRILLCEIQDDTIFPSWL